MGVTLVNSFEANSGHHQALGVFAAGAEQVLAALPDPAIIVNREPDGVMTVAWANPPAHEWGIAAIISAATTAVTGTDLWQLLEDQSTAAVARTIAVEGRGSLTATITASPLPTPPPDTTPRYLLTVREAARELASAELARERGRIEQRARLGLRIVAQVSVILADSEITRPLGEISALLSDELVLWARCYQDRNGLSPVMTMTEPGVGQRNLRRLRRDKADVPDPVGDIMARRSLANVILDRELEYDPATLTAELLTQLRQDAPPGPVWVLPIAGRRTVFGLLVVVPQAETRPPTLGYGGLPETLTLTRHNTQAEVQGLSELPGLGRGGVEDVGTILELVTRRIGMAMDNTQFYEREHRLADSLQRAMLPTQSTVAELDVWTYYAPNADHAQVGGDWYDVLNVTDQGIGIVVGDVVGHDIEAAAAMGQIRSIVRAYAMEFQDPATVLERVDRAVAVVGIDRPSSCLYAHLAPADNGAWRLTYSRAGHLPPVILKRGEAQLLDEANGSLIGFGNQPRQVATDLCHPGDVLVFYTDGLVERRRRPMLEGIRELLNAAQHAQSIDAAGIGEEILLRLANAPEDDIAVVVVRIPGVTQPGAAAGATPRQRRWNLPAEPSAVARARHAVVQAAKSWGVEDVAPIELVTSEIVTNAVLHGWGPVGLRLEDTGDGVRIEVSDGNPSPPVRRDRDSARVGGFGLHIMDRLADWGWRPTPKGKVVWARMRTQPQRSAGAGDERRSGQSA